MQTQFDIIQLAKPEIAEAERVLRKCVHCGFCLATCPTYLLLGDERDSPRGRIYMIKDMLESGGAAKPATVRHIDRCLSCLSCMTTCPSGVDYMHLVDHARNHIAETHTRPALERLLRRLLGYLLPRPTLFRIAVLAARGPAMLGQFLPGSLGALMRLSFRPVHAPSWIDKPQTIAAAVDAGRLKRVALLSGCVQKALAPQINEASARVLARHGCEVVVTKDAGCCGALALHQGERAAAQTWARTNIGAFLAEHRRAPLDAVIANASGCGTMLKDYGDLFRNDPAMASNAGEVAALTRDISEIFADLPPLKTAGLAKLRVAYHGACSMQHGQNLHDAPKALLAEAGFDVCEAADGHLCCGSAGTYNILQPALAKHTLIGPPRMPRSLSSTSPSSSGETSPRNLSVRCRFSRLT